MSIALMMPSPNSCAAAGHLSTGLLHALTGWHCLCERSITEVQDCMHGDSGNPQHWPSALGRQNGQCLGRSFTSLPMALMDSP